MVDQKEKTLSYRRAEWLDNKGGLTLEKCLRDAHKNLKNISERTISYGGHEMTSAAQKDRAGGLLLHLTSDTPGEAASVVPKVAPTSQQLDLLTAQPPRDGEWLDGDAFLFVQDDHVCLCTTGIRDGSIDFFLREFFRKANLRKDSDQFLLMKVADITALKLLHNQGVDEIEMRASLFKATAEYEKRKSQAYGGLGAAGKFFKSLLKKSNDYTHDSLRVGVTLKVDRRFSKSIKLGEKRIEEIAASIVKNSQAGDDFAIITKTGQRIGPKEIFIRSKVPIDAEGKTVNRDKAWVELEKFFKMLKSTGAVEQ